MHIPEFDIYNYLRITATSQRSKKSYVPSNAKRWKAKADENVYENVSYKHGVDCVGCGRSGIMFSYAVFNVYVVHHIFGVDWKITGRPETLRQNTFNDFWGMPFHCFRYIFNNLERNFYRKRHTLDIEISCVFYFNHRNSMLGFLLFCLGSIN